MARERENLPVEVRPYRVGLALSGGGAKGFAVKNVFINAGKLWAVKSMGSFRIGLFTHLSWCPLKEDMNCVGGISLRM